MKNNWFRLLLITLSSYAFFGLSGCATPTDNGLVTGGIIGGIAGSAITGGSTAGTIAGAVGGAVIGRDAARRNRDCERYYECY